MNIPAPPGKTYLPYQEKGIRYALGARGTFLADEMGLGKTIQAIGLINASGAARVLIVCPAGLRLNWTNELTEWLWSPQSEVVVLTYDGAQRLADDNIIPPSIDLLIIDEAHYIKNANSKRSAAIKKLAYEANRVVLISGTPMVNCPIELWPLLQIVAPDEFDPPKSRFGVITQEEKDSHPGEGPNFWAYAKRYCALKKSRFRVKGRMRSAWDFSGASNLIELQSRLRKTCMVRRLKKDVLPELPEKRRQVIVLENDSKEDHSWWRSIFLSEISEANYEFMVQQLTADKVLFEEFSKRRHEQALAKVDAVLRFLQDAFDGSEKIILFAHHGDVIESYAKSLALKEYNPVVVTGKTHVADRGAAVKRFQEDPACRLFIGSIGAAGVGITLTASSHVIFAELDPVPGRMTQAEDRAHRIGQRDSVLVQHLVLDKTLCARMAKILVKKQRVLSAALDGESQGVVSNV